MRWLLVLLIVLVIAAIAGVIYVRTAAHDPARWHIDPATVTEVNTDNEFLDSRIIAGSPDAIASTLLSELDGEVLAGDLAKDWSTFVVRTPLIGYPDYVSVRMTPAADGTRVTLFSRSRFGKSDLGANKARVQRVFEALKSGSENNS